MPRQLIPFKSSRFCQGVTIVAEAGSTVVYSETLAAGRIASAEKFDFDACFLRIDAYDSGSHLLFADACNIEPSYSGKAALERLFAGKGIWSTIFILSDKDNIAPLEKEIGDEIPDSSVLAGCTILPNECGLVVRMLDDSIDKIEQRVATTTRIVRSHVAGNRKEKS